MSKVKPPKSKGITNKHLHARTTFLYQAAACLTLQATSNEAANISSIAGATSRSHSQDIPGISPLAKELCSDLQQVSRKAQLRLSVDLKRTMCKCCNTVLMPGRTATQTVENLSKGGRKPWADVLVLECTTCGGKKRFPIGAKKQLKKSERKAVATDVTSVTSPDDGNQMESGVQTSTEAESTAADSPGDGLIRPPALSTTG